jgi:hypothetical protein
MISHRVSWLVALAALIGGQAMGFAAEVDLSLNLEFNTPGDALSGGTWTVVGKADERGLAGVSLVLTNINFNASGFLAPMEFEVQEFSTVGTIINIVAGDDVVPPLPLDIGVIGGPFPSSYVDDPNLVPFLGNQDLGSFTGGVALATGSFNPGVIPAWAVTPGGDPTDANVFVGTTIPGAVVDANTQLTVRHIIPEPTTMGLAGISALALLVSARRRAR